MAKGMEALVNAGHHALAVVPLNAIEFEEAAHEIQGALDVVAQEVTFPADELGRPLGRAAHSARPRNHAQAGPGQVGLARVTL